MAVVLIMPKEKAKTFARSLIEAIFGNHDIPAVDTIDSLHWSNSMNLLRNSFDEPEQEVARGGYP